MQARVSFLICGTQKGGTTALDRYLREHPKLFLPQEKELHFFDDESQNWHQPNYENYHDHFCSAAVNQICGEATPIYMYWNQTAERIWKYNPNMNIVLILRNPITRAYSHWAMEHNRGAELLSFENAIQLEEQRCQQQAPHQDRIHSYIDRGFYSSQIRRMWNLFGRKRVIILRQEALSQDPLPSLNTICRHLGIEEMPMISRIQEHLGTYNAPMSDAMRNQLQQIFRGEIILLESMLGWDCSSWIEA